MKSQEQETKTVFRISVEPAHLLLLSSRYKIEETKVPCDVMEAEEQG